MPGLPDRHLARTGFASQQTAPHDPDAPVNLFEPADGRYGHDFGAHGVFGDRTIGCHPQLWASRHHGMLAAVGVAALSGLVRRLWNRW